MDHHNTPEPEQTPGPEQEYQTAYEDFRINEEMRYQQKRMAAEGMASMMLDLIGDKMDPDRKEMFKDAWVEMMVPEPPQIPPGVVISPLPQFKPMPPSTFEEDTPETTTFYDWHCLLQRSSHFVRNKSTGTLLLCKGGEIVLELRSGPAIDSFMAYAAAAKDRWAAPGMMR